MQEHKSHHHGGLAAWRRPVQSHLLADGVSGWGFPWVPSESSNLRGVRTGVSAHVSLSKRQALQGKALAKTHGEALNWGGFFPSRVVWPAGLGSAKKPCEHWL